MGADGHRWELARTTRAPGEARRHVDGYRDELGEDAWRRARLLVSELATNALRHGAGRIELLVKRTANGLRICVQDEGGGRPTPRAPGDDGGFGLHLVADMADRWGQAENRACIWFEVDRVVAL